MNAYDDNGNPLPNGEKLIGGLRINKNAFGCYRISDIAVTVTNINDEYYSLYNTIESGEKAGTINYAGPTINSFLIIDKEEFKKHGLADIYFDINNFAPDGDLTGKPYNYFRIDIIVKDLENILNNNIDIFNFDSITNDGQTNISISESLKNCVFDPELILNFMNTVIRTLPQIQQAQADAWVYGAIVAILALAVAILISSLINWRSDRKDYITRRIWFVVIGIVASLGYWLYNMQVIVPTIQNAGFQNMFKETNLYVLLASAGGYFIVGILLMLCFRNSKLGSILGRKKD